MAGFTIEKRKNSKGEFRYRCTVRAHQGSQVVYRESRTFGRKSDAQTWGIQMQASIERDGIPGQSMAIPSIGELIAKYLSSPTLMARTGRTKEYVLKLLMDCDIGRIQADKLVESDLVRHCEDRVAAGASPQTVAHDVSYLSSVMAAAWPHFKIEASNQVVKQAQNHLRYAGLIGKSERRTRRPVGDELARLEEALAEREGKRQSKIPFRDILQFSILSCMRIGEVCSICWEDVSEQTKSVLVRDRKDPRKKQGNHMQVPLLGDAWTILQRQPRTDERVFPFESRSVTAGFQRVRNKLGIQDLRYHDLRREGASRLFEAGFSLDEVAQVTGHRDLNILWQIYTQLYPSRVHEKFETLRKEK